MLCLKWHKAVYNSIYYIFLKLSNIKYEPPKGKKKPICAEGDKNAFS